MKRNETTKSGVTRKCRLLFAVLGFVFLGISAQPAAAHSLMRTTSQKERAPASGEKLTWKTVDFAIVRYNDDAPASWNMFHGDKKGLLLLRLWRRYLLVNVQEQEVFEIDPGTVKIQGENAEWAPADAPTEPIETSDWKVRDVGPMQRVRFRFGTSGNFLDIQIPRLANGKPAY